MLTVEDHPSATLLELSIVVKVGVGVKQELGLA